MRTMHPVLKRGGLFWDRDLLPPQGYIERFARIQAKIAACGDDAWLVYGDVERYGSLAYFSNFLPRTRSALALVPCTGDPALLVSVGLRDVPAAKTLTWVDDVRPFARLPRLLISLMEEKGLLRARLGLVSLEELLSVKDWSEISKALPNLRTVSRMRELAQMRASKDAAEREAIRRTARVIAGALDFVPHTLAPGKAMRAITAELDGYIRAHAAEDVRIMVASGERAGVSLRPADDRTLKSGDTVLLYVAAEVQRYWAEGARSFLLGRVPDHLRNFVARGSQALAAMRAASRAGASAQAIARAADDLLVDEKRRASARAYGYGNSIGLMPRKRR